MEGTILVCGKAYHIRKLLGHGKGGYSYLADGEEGLVVVKQIHHEPCSYYTFGGKIASEDADYQKLKRSGIRIPERYAIDLELERVVKAYIPGETVFERLRRGEGVDAYLPQVREMARQAEAAGLNIDYYPTNFVICRGLIWYVDYECNPYDAQWDF